MVKILGLDPGLQNTGWGIIYCSGNHLSYISHGTIHTKANENIASRLNYIHFKLNEVLSAHSPDEAAVEEIFVNKNPASTLKLGMARGVALFTPASFGIKVFEYSANKIKKSVVGSGHAEKHQVAFMVKKLMPSIPEKITADASDALAIAICHYSHRILLK